MTRIEKKMIFEGVGFFFLLHKVKKTKKQNLLPSFQIPVEAFSQSNHVLKPFGIFKDACLL